MMNRLILSLLMLVPAGGALHAQCNDSELLKIVPTTDPSNRYGNQIVVDGDRMAINGGNRVDVWRVASRWPWSLALEEELVEPSIVWFDAIELQGDELFTVQGYPPVVQVRRFDGTRWVTAEALGAADLEFGTALDVQGDRLVVAGDDVHVFHFDGSVWGHFQSFPVPTGGISDVAIDGNRIVVGDESASLGGVQFSGAAFVYQFDGNTWSLEQQIALRRPQVEDWFGGAVDIDGGTIAVGAHRRKINDVRTGAVVLFEHVGGSWVLTQVLQSSNPENRSFFGSVLDLENGVLAVGAHWEDRDRNDRAGAAYTFRRRAGTWLAANRMHMISPGSNVAFGAEIELGPDYVLVASPGEVRHGQNYAGACSIFEVNPLELRLSEDEIPYGSSFDIEVCGGLPGSPVLFVLTRIESSPSFSVVGLPVLNSAGSWRLTRQAPAGATIGPNEFGITVFGLDGEGRLLASRELGLSFVQ